MCSRVFALVQLARLDGTGMKSDERPRSTSSFASRKIQLGDLCRCLRQFAPIMYVAQLMGGTTEQAIRLLILLMVLTCDPLALALTAAASRPKVK